MFSLNWKIMGGELDLLAHEAARSWGVVSHIVAEESSLSFSPGKVTMTKKGVEPRPGSRSPGRRAEQVTKHAVPGKDDSCT